MMIKVLAKICTAVCKVVDFFHGLDERIVNFVLSIIERVLKEMKAGGYRD
jgi:hypothetical protein